MGDTKHRYLYEVGDVAGETLAALDQLDTPELLTVLLVVARRAEDEDLLAPAELAWLRLVLERALRQAADRAA